MEHQTEKPDKLETDEIPVIERSRPYGEIESIVRGLGRTSFVGRAENGMPITAEGLAVQRMMQDNAMKNSRQQPAA